MTSAAPARGIPWRAIGVGTLLLPVNALWLVQMEVAATGSAHGTTSVGPYPSTLSLFANVICFIAALTALNGALRRLRPRWVLRQGELLVVYAMLTIGTCLTSIDFLDVLFPMLGHPVHYATPSNQWSTLIIPYLKPWLYVRDAGALKAWYEGGADPWALRHLKAWAVPVLSWSAFAAVLIGVMLCLNVLIRRQWTRNERLSYPIIQLPIEMSEEGGAFYRSRAMWAGFAAAAGVNLLNGMAVLYPGVPSLPIKAHDISVYFPNAPWNAMGWTPIALYPFAIGLGFLLPVDLLFSSWFFCLMWRAERVVSSAYGWSDARPSFPYVNEQSFGAYAAVALLALWGARRHLAEMMRTAWASSRRGPGEPMSARAALVGAALGVVFLVGFFHAAGLPLWMCVVAFAIYLAIAVACTRMRAEFGAPAHDLHNGGPDYILTAAFGARAFGPQTLAALTWFWWFNRAYRSIAMPYQLEAFKIAERRGLSMRGMAIALVIAGAVGLASGCLALYALPYRYGAESRMASHFPYFGWEAFNRLNSWLQAPRDTDVPAVLAVFLGGVVVTVLHAIRMRAGWWPFHPLGFAVSGSFSMSTLWVPLLIAWACKALVLRYGGLRSYRAARPFFLGLMLGEYLIGCAWPIVGWALRANTYSYYF